MDELYIDEFGNPLDMDDVFDDDSDLPDELFDLPEDEFNKKMEELEDEMLKKCLDDEYEEYKNGEVKSVKSHELAYYEHLLNDHSEEINN